MSLDPIGGNVPANPQIQNAPLIPALPTLEPISQPTVAVEGARAMAEIQAAVFMAKQFPRDCLRSRDNILKACQRPQLAKTATYQYVRGGSSIIGPSIRLAEMLANEWGNVRYGFVELEQTQFKTVAQAFAWNIETNVKVTRTITVKHERATKKGTVFLTDPRDIYEMVANFMQRRVRACILAVIPGDIVEEALEECEKTLRATADTSPEGIKKLLDAFSALGVTREIIEKHIQRNVEAITPGNIVNLRRIYQSIKDGIGVPKDYFEMPEEPEKKTAASGKLTGMKKQLTAASSKPDETPAEQEK